MEDARIAQPEGGVGGRPGPGAEPENDAQSVRDEEENAEEQLRCEALKGDGCAKDQERLEGLCWYETNLVSHFIPRFV